MGYPITITVILGPQADDLLDMVTDAIAAEEEGMLAGIPAAIQEQIRADRIRLQNFIKDVIRLPPRTADDTTSFNTVAEQYRQKYDLSPDELLCLYTNEYALFLFHREDRQGKVLLRCKPTVVTASREWASFMMTLSHYSGPQ